MVQPAGVPIERDGQRNDDIMSDSDVPRPDHTAGWIKNLNPDEAPTFLREFVRELKARCQSDPEYYQRRYLAKRRESWLYHTFGTEMIAWPPEWVRAQLHAGRN